MNPMNSGEVEAVQRYSAKGSRGWLKNNNKPGDPSKSPRCGAHKRDGTPCRAPAMWSRRTGRYTRCRLHGGCSTGPRTPEGLALSKRARWKHGQCSQEHREYRREMRAWIAYFNAELKVIARELRPILRARRQQDRQGLIVGCATLEGGFDLAAVLRA
jgi:hypothetical protein